MKNIFTVLLTVTFTTCAFLVVLCQESSWASPPKRLFIIHSYENGHICGQPQHAGAIKALEEAGFAVGRNIVIGTYYMDTKKNNNTPPLIQEQAVNAKNALIKFKPDAVLTLDDNAFRTVALQAAGDTTAYVFSGLNGQPEMYNEKIKFMESRAKPSGNITGVYEKLYIREAIQVLSTMHRLDKVLILDDQSPTGKAIAKQVELELFIHEGASPTPSELEQRTINSWEEFTQVINEINNDDQIGAFYLGTLLLHDAAGKVYTASEIIDYTLENAKKPAIGLNYAFIKLGLYGGATVDFFAMGHLAGQKIAEILKGGDPGIIPIEDAPKVALVFNLKRANDLSMDIPPDILMAADEVFSK
ncbi:ABC transporter substrate-binding protein [Desulfopila sp. IMCC35008]|uniref:ABC transporter substrate-binding protein n=1 Tax=Desulfopila sp. IMCC35008 TaxID=2653858 RepID=UPI0013D1CEA6|nr:ABC transporter substrate binding protein [Desulfopila sp. IMCC35008]